TIRLGGRFDPGLRVEGLLELGTSEISISDASMEQFDNMARTIAAQVIDEGNRGLMVGCEPRSPTEPDDACARQFLSEVGRLLFRRPLSEDEEQLYVKA